MAQYSGNGKNDYKKQCTLQTTHTDSLAKRIAAHIAVTYVAQAWNILAFYVDTIHAIKRVFFFQRRNTPTEHIAAAINEKKEDTRSVAVGNSFYKLNSKYVV